MIDPPNYLTTLELFTLTKAVVLYLSAFSLARGARERDPSPDTRTREQRVLDDLHRGMSRRQVGTKHGVSDYDIDGIVHAAALQAVQAA